MSHLQLFRKLQMFLGKKKTGGSLHGEAEKLAGQEA